MKKIPAYIIVLGLVATLAWAPLAAAYYKVQIVELSAYTISGGIPIYKEIPNGSKLTVSCSYQLVAGVGKVDPDSNFRVVISDNGVVKDSTLQEVISSTTVRKRVTSYTVIGPGPHTIKCQVFDELYSGGKLTQKTLSDEMTVSVNVVADKGKPIQDTKWPTAPIIVTPGQNQKVLAPVKILVKPRDPNKNCTDNGVLMLSKEKKGPKKLSKPLPFKSCKPEGSIWELDLVPGEYQIRAKHTNKKYNFESDWSDWVTFEVVK
jgi:hypothetical protein